MKTNSNKRFSCKHDRKVFVAEESTKSWTDSHSDSSSSSSSSSESEQEEVHCFMADQTDKDEVFYFSNFEFTRDDLVIALNDMVKEYRKLSHSFEEAKAENMSLKSSSAESSSDELEDTDILKTELSKLQAENEMLRNEISELKAEVNKSTVEMSSWNKANLSLQKLYESQKQASDKTGIGFNNSTLTLYHSSEMAYSLISRSHHIDFDSVFRFDDTGIVQMFESLVSTGLMEFLGCPAIFHEQALIDFFENGSVRDGMVVSTISGTAVEISESVFAAEFGLPTEGLTDLSESTQIKDLKKGFVAPVGTIFQDLFDIKKNQRAHEAKLNALDGQVAALRNDQLEFQNRISADLLSLSTQFADIVEFIRSGDAKKGESGSSSRPPPVRVERRPLPTPQSPRDVAGGSSAVRIPTFPRTTGTIVERVEQARRHLLESGLVISVEEAAERIRQADLQE
ncbi:hypothetical protein F511_25643 [Dorcoceras hygrometricum]|uniref:Uncharacterized protein n=1 Tax=Dorcoceras hygrometricum TaxID=472368 RepID=A0A2Z7BYH3_9LAMI|nr:hypothetical protein F511_25643 [Dorcoceras hygrometricum]